MKFSSFDLFIEVGLDAALGADADVYFSFLLHPSVLRKEIKMKKMFSFLILCPLMAQAKEINYKKYYEGTEGCFILFNLKESKIIEEFNSKFCKTPMAPNSTFKIPLSLMGYDKKILKDENNPKWEFKEKYLSNGFDSSWMPVQWKESNTPSSWMKYSVVWYSQKLTPLLGSKVIKEYLYAFDYGNKDFSGTLGKNDGLENAWLESSLKISAENQIQFLKKFVLEILPVTKQSLQMTKKLLYIEQSKSNTDFYGKTGGGFIKNKYAHGWFVGWIEKDNNTFIFASQIKNKEINREAGGLKAKKIAMEILQEIDLL